MKKTAKTFKSIEGDTQYFMKYNIEAHGMFLMTTNEAKEK